jgi:hypothetical protein
MAFIQDSTFFFIGKRPKLTVDLDLIKPGDEIKVTYFQTFKKNLILEMYNLELNGRKFIKKNGAITSRDEKEFYKIEESNIQCFQEQEIIKQYAIKIPTKEVLSELIEGNLIDIELKVRYKTSVSNITFTEDFKLKVEV